MNLTETLTNRATDIHARNVTAGWWTDLKTKKSTLKTRNRAELMMLVVSEVSEADHGRANNLNDDKLPHLPMFDVELADVAIRLFDMIGAENSLYGDVVAYDYEAKAAKVFAKAQGDFSDSFFHRIARYFGFRNDYWFKAIVNELSAAMEHLRKGRTTEHRLGLAAALAATIGVAKAAEIDLFAVIDEKLAFNAQRADHKPENRVKDGGKAF